MAYNRPLDHWVLILLQDILPCNWSVYNEPAQFGLPQESELEVVIVESVTGHSQGLYSDLDTCNYEFELAIDFCTFHDILPL